VTSVRVRGDDGHEESAVVDLVLDLLIPGVPAPQLGLIEKHLDAFGVQGIAQVLRGFLVLGCIA